MDVLAVHEGRLIFQRSVGFYGTPASDKSSVGFVVDEIRRSYRYLQDNDLPSPVVLRVSAREGDGIISGMEEDSTLNARMMDTFKEPGFVPASLQGALAASEGAGQHAVNLLPHRIRRRHQSIQKVREWAFLAVSLLVLLGLILSINDSIFGKEEEYLRFIHRSTLGLGSQAHDLSTMMDQIRRTRNQIEAQYRLLAIINEIASFTPIDVGIDYMSFEPDQSVLLGGQAVSRAALFEFMAKLEGSEEIDQVEAHSMPLRQMTSGEVVDYRLELKLGGGEGP